MKERFGAQKEQSLMLRFHTQTSGASLTAQQPLNNVVRTTIEALAAVLGGTQACTPTATTRRWACRPQEAATLALRTQQIIGYESGVAATADPLAGSYVVEALTDALEAKAWELIERIDAHGRRGRGDRAGLDAGRDRRGGLPIPAAGRSRASRWWWA